MLNELLIQYADQFGDSFPLFQVKQLDEDEIISLVQTSIESNVPYESNYQDNVDY